MNILVYHLVSGDAYFSGCAMIVLAMFISRLNLWGVRSLSTSAYLVGLLFVLLTAVPENLLELALLILFLMCSWLALFFFIERSPQQNSGQEDRSDGKSKLRVKVVLISLIAMTLSCILELSWRSTPKFTEKVPRTLTVLADSVTAGIGENEAVTWPQIIAANHSLKVHDYSRMGATVGSQLKWLSTREIPEGVILIELGGNDMLGATTVSQFEEELDRLLQRVSLTSQPVVMFELPLPPAFNRFGMVQRKLSKKYGVQLIPKQVFAKILSTAGATLDTIHLSQSGHNLMTVAVWKDLQTAFMP